MPATHKLQAPKGTRDFFPADMAVRRHIESAWRSASVGHGFDEIDGPTFEHLELYTIKSGPGIVSELFSFRRAGGETDYALRPEFTPTLARMVAARGGEMQKPIKWFSMPAHFRAERPQRGRLREFLQWNVDLLGDDAPRADAEVIAVAVAALERLGLGPDQVVIRINDRQLVNRCLDDANVPETNREAALELIDKHDRIPRDEFQRRSGELGLDAFVAAVLPDDPGSMVPLRKLLDGAASHSDPMTTAAAAGFTELGAALDALGLLSWCAFDRGIVRGLAYYTGTVFEVHERSGAERAIAGGGRYDHLVELFGGPPTPAVGFAMGDVVLRLVLEEHQLLEDPQLHAPRPDVFVINGRDEPIELHLLPLVAALRRAGWHVRHSYRVTRNVKKLLGEANRSRARLACILGQELASGAVVLKDLGSGEQTEVPLETVGDAIEQRLVRG